MTMRGLFGGGRPTAGVEDWVGWGPCSGTQSLALRPQQMAAEQRGCREALIVHSEWLSVREQRGSAEEEGGREVEGDQILGTVDRASNCTFWGRNRLRLDWI